MSESSLARPFLPMRLLHLLGRCGEGTHLPAAVLVADLTNFTGLTEALTHSAGLAAGDSGTGAIGGELVARGLNQALGPAVDVVMRHGGDVVKFSGDGLLCLFLGDAEARTAAQRAVDEVAALVVRGPSGELHRFRLAAAHGPVMLVRVGGHGGRHELVAGGAAVERAQQGLRQATPGLPCPIEHLPLPPGLAHPVLIPVEDAESYLPAFVRERLTDDLAQWLKQVRTLTLVFVAIEAEGRPAALQRGAHACQVIVDSQAGQLLRFGLEGRFLEAEIAFGLAVGAHSAGPAEALQCAAALVRALPGSQVGVSTGRVLLGPVGSAARRQLTSLGSAVNLAARLMQQAGGGEVLVDEATWAAAGEGRLHGERLSGTLKGLGKRSFIRLATAAPPVRAPTQAIFGRADETRLVCRALDDLAAPSRPIVIQGEAGIGKSRLAGWLSDELRARGVEVWTALCTPVGRDTPYSSLAPVVAALCGLRPGEDDAGRLREAAEQLLGDGSRMALLRDALGLSSRAEAPTGADLSGHVRADHIRENLLALLRARSAPTGAALLVEDAHWLDDTSWLLLQRVVSEIRSLRVVIAIRPLADTEPAPLQAIRAQALGLALEPLPDRDIVAVVAQRLQLPQVPPSLARWIIGRVHGNPFFAQELATTLVAKSRLKIRDGAVLRTPSTAELDALSLPTTIESTIEQRIAALGAENIAVLNLASVIGPTFGENELVELSSGAAGAGVAAVLARLVVAQMAVEERSGRFAFRHRYTQEAAYLMMPEEQRRELHARVAGWLETRLAERADERAGDLAHHWFRADDRPKATQWLERAGGRALNTGADSEAATHFRRALSLGHGEALGRRAAWHRQLAQALFGLGQVEGVAAQARSAFELVAHPLPAGARGWTGLALATAARRLLGRLRPALAGQLRGAGRSARSPHDQLEGARAAALLAEAAYFVNEPEMMLGAALLAVDMAERTALAAPVATAYGMLAVVVGMARMHGTATHYLARARAIAEEAGDPYQQGVAWFYAGIYFGCLGDWQASLDASQRGLALTDSVGAYMLSGRQLTVIATNALYTSEYGKTREWIHVVRMRAERLSNVQQMGWAGNVVSVADLHQGRYANAIENAERSREIFLLERDLISLTISEGVRCVALCRSGHMSDALEGADRVVQLVQGARPTTWGQLEGFAAPCEVYATALDQRLVAQPVVRARLRTALKALRLFALVFPFGRARHAWICGLLARADGRTGASRWHLRRAIAVARRFAMPYEELRAVELLAPLLSQHEREQLLGGLAALQARVDDGTPSVHPAVQAV